MILVATRDVGLEARAGQVDGRERAMPTSSGASLAFTNSMN